jgi:hypothetical protein
MGDPGSKIARNQFGLLFEANWILELDPSALALGSSNHELSFLALFLFFVFFFGVWRSIDFPSKMVPCRFSLKICHFLVLDPYLNAIESKFMVLIQ